MRIGLVSFRINGRNNFGKVAIVINLINSHSDLDMLIFPGWTLDSQESLNSVIQNNRNVKTQVFIETKEPKVGYILKHRRIIKGNLRQCFENSADINQMGTRRGNILCFLDKLKQDRSFRINNKTARLLICGENNILRNIRIEQDSAEFRFRNDDGLNLLWRALYGETQIFINPAHTQMVREREMRKRREYLSSGKRIYCFTTNKDRGSGNLAQQRTLQYLYYDGQPLVGELRGVNENCILRKFNVVID